ncbi:MAG: hypothetical protein ACK4FL_00850 [Microgenomates group bacterium]
MGFKETYNGSDIPTEYTSSIGATVWPPVETNNERLKGVYPKVLENIDQLNQFLEEFASLKFTSNSSRITARALVSNEALLPKSLINPKLIETVIPLEGCDIKEVSDCLLVYFGKNAPTRQTKPEILNRQYQQVYEIFFGNRTNNQGLTQKNILSEFSIRSLTETERCHPNVLQMYFKLYSLFNWTLKDVEEMLTNTRNLIVAAFDSEGNIISSALAEQGIMNFEREGKEIELSLVEITEAATLPTYRGKGLYQAVSNKILEELANKDPAPHLVFGELNLDAPPVLKVAAQQGRIPAISTAYQYRMPNSWFLEQHVVIYQGDGSKRLENYNNLMVAFLPRNLLIQKYGR